MGGSVVGLHEGGHLRVELLHAGLVDQAKVGQGVAAAEEDVGVAAAAGVEQAQLGAGFKHAFGVFAQIGKGWRGHGGWP